MTQAKSAAAAATRIIRRGNGTAVAVLAAAEKEVLRRCVRWQEAEYGYGPAIVYHFDDGSTLVDDGRGYTTERKP